MIVQRDVPMLNYIMELKNNITFLLTKIQKCINCVHLPHVHYSCCAPSSLPDYTHQNLFSTNPPYSPLLQDSESDRFTTGQKSFGLILPHPMENTAETDLESLTAYGCSLLPCLNKDTVTSVCACNFNTGNVVTFKNNCDVEKHNCRFNTKFKVILNEICPWEFESRRNNKDLEIDYSDPKYYN